jgi:hypothetical protein
MCPRAPTIDRLQVPPRYCLRPFSRFKGTALQKQKQEKRSPLRGSKHHETKLCSPRDRFSPAVRIELGENGGDVKLGGVKRDSQSTCDRFVGGAVCQRCKDFELAGRQQCADSVIAIEHLISIRACVEQRRQEFARQDNKAVGDRLDCSDDLAALRQARQDTLGPCIERLAALSVLRNLAIVVDETP